MLFDAIESCLKGTSYENFIDDMFFGESHSYIQCTECDFAIKVPEKFMDLPLFVNGVKGVNDSLDLYFKPEEIDGFGCNACQKTTKVLKGPQVKKLPPVLTFNLTRIKYDPVTWDRVKINDRFEFPLEIDMTKYLE